MPFVTRYPSGSGAPAWIKTISADGSGGQGTPGTPGAPTIPVTPAQTSVFLDGVRMSSLSDPITVPSGAKKYLTTTDTEQHTLTGAITGGGDLIIGDQSLPLSGDYIKNVGAGGVFFSTRRLFAAYTGPAFSLLDSAGAAFDIYFGSDGEINEAGMVGHNLPYRISTWYNQGGTLNAFKDPAGSNATMPTLVRDGNNWVVDFVSTQYLTTAIKVADVFSSASASTLFVVEKTAQDSGPVVSFLSPSTGLYIDLIPSIGGQIYWDAPYSLDRITGTSTNPGTWRSIIARRDAATTQDVRAIGITVGTRQPTASVWATNAWDTLRLSWPENTGYVGRTKEVIWVPFFMSDAAIEDVEYEQSVRLNISSTASSSVDWSHSPNIVITAASGVGVVADKGTVDVSACNYDVKSSRSPGATLKRAADPNDITKKVAYWWRTKWPGDVETDGQGVTRWIDQSGNNKHIDRTGLAAPSMYPQYDALARCIRFSQVQKFLPTFIAYKTNFSLLSASAYAAADGRKRYISTTTSQDPGANSLIGHWNGTMLFYDSTLSNLQGPTVNGSSICVYGACKEPGRYLAMTKGYNAVNNTTVSFDTVLSLNGSVVEPGNINAFDLIFTPTTLTDAQMRQILAYLSWTVINDASLLDASNPYQTKPPIATITDASTTIT